MISEKVKSLAGDVLAFGIGGFAVRAASFFMVPLYTYFLTTEDYAVVDLVTLSVQLAIPLLTCSISDALLRFGLDDSKNRRQVVGSAFLISIFGVAIAALLCASLGLMFENRVLALCAFLYFVGQLLLTVYGAYFKCCGRTKAMASISAFAGIMTIAINVVAIAFLHFGIIGYWVGNVLGCACGVVAYLIFGGLRAFSYIKSWNKECLKAMLLYSIPLIPNSIFWWVNSSMDRFLLTVLTSLSFTGLYSVALKIPQILSTIGGYFFQAWNISVFKDFGSRESYGFICKGFKIVSVLLFVISSCLIVLAEPLGKLLFSGNFYQAWTLVPLLVVGTSVSLLNQFLGSIFTAAKDTKEIFVTTAMGSIVNVVSCALFIILFGGLGAVVATALSYVAVYGARAIKIARKYPEIQLSHGMPVVQILTMVIASALVMQEKPYIAALVSMLVFAANVIKLYKCEFRDDANTSIFKG